jgi:enoyl-CoA hydratase
VYSFLIVEKDNGVAMITLNRPEVLNAQNTESLGELNRALQDAEIDESIGVVVIKGSGRAFCSGMDLKNSFGDRGAAQMEKSSTLGTRFGTVCTTIENMSKPVIAAVHGYAVTGGCLISYTADLLVAAENAQFIDTHARWGLIPGAGESQRLPRRVGLHKAKEMFFTCDPIDAKEAKRIGLANYVVPLEKLDKAVKELSNKILKNSRNSISVIKALLNKGARADFETGMKLEWEFSKGGMINLEPNEDRDARLRAFK